MKEAFLFFLIIIFAFGLVFQVQADVSSVDTQGVVQEEEEEEAPTPAPSGGGGGMSSVWFMPPKAPEGGFRVLINEGAEYTDSLIVTLSLFGGPDTARMAISNFSDFRDAGQNAYQTSKSWNLCQGKTECPEDEYIIYAKFYADWGTASEVVSDSIIYGERPIIEKIKQKLVEIAEKIADLKNQIARLFEKEIVAEVPEAPPEEIVPPEKELLDEEIVSPPEEISPEKEKVRPLDLLKEYIRWLWQKITNFWQKIWPF